MDEAEAGPSGLQKSQPVPADVFSSPKKKRQKQNPLTASEKRMRNVAMFVYGAGEQLVPAHMNFGKFLLDRLRKVDPDRSCLHNYTTGERLSYSEFAQHAVGLAAALAQVGVRRGDTVAVAGDAHVTLLPTALAVMLTGATCTLIVSQCGGVVLEHKLTITKPKYLICSRLFWEASSDILKGLDFIQTFISFEAVEGIPLCMEALVSKAMVTADVASFEPAAVDGSADVAMIGFTSGTTGMSKGVVLTHVNCIAESNLYAQWFKDYDSLPTSKALETVFIPGPELPSTYDFSMLTASICTGKTVIYTENEMNLRVLQEFQVDAMPTVPAVVEMILNAEEEYDLGSLKLVYAAGSTLSPRSAKAFRKRYPDVKLIYLYGASEVGAIVTTQNTILYKDTYETIEAGRSSVGEAAPGVIIKVVDVETRAVLGPNQRGEICVWSPRLIKGYLGDASLLNLDEKGFYLTGDLGYFDDHKRFYLVDRLKNVICFLDYRVCPGEVEAVLRGHPGVREAAVVGAPARVDGERPAAFVVRKRGAQVTEGELVDYVAQQVTWYMRLTGGVRFVSELPSNPNGKVLRRQLREMLELKGNGEQRPV